MHTCQKKKRKEEENYILTKSGENRQNDRSRICWTFQTSKGWKYWNTTCEAYWLLSLLQKKTGNTTSGQYLYLQTGSYTMSSCHHTFLVPYKTNQLLLKQVDENNWPMPNRIRTWRIILLSFSYYFYSNSSYGKLGISLSLI